MHLLVGAGRLVLGGRRDGQDEGGDGQGAGAVEVEHLFIMDRREPFHATRAPTHWEVAQ